MLFLIPIAACGNLIPVIIDQYGSVVKFNRARVRDKNRVCCLIVIENTVDIRRFTCKTGKTVLHIGDRRDFIKRNLVEILRICQEEERPLLQAGRLQIAQPDLRLTQANKIVRADVGQVRDALTELICGCIDIGIPVLAGPRGGIRGVHRLHSGAAGQGLLADGTDVAGDVDSLQLFQGRERPRSHRHHVQTAQHIGHLQHHGAGVGIADHRGVIRVRNPDILPAVLGGDVLCISGQLCRLGRHAGKALRLHDGGIRGFRLGGRADAKEVCREKARQHAQHQDQGNHSLHVFHVRVPLIYKNRGALLLFLCRCRSTTA